MNCRGRNRAVSLTLMGIALIGVSACGAGYEAQQQPSTPDVATVVGDVTSPMVVSHRGGAAVYPEETMAGFEASAKAGFYPEMDIQFLDGGEAVLVHDETADRTMTGVTGPIEDITADEWDEAEVKSPTGGPSEPAVYFTDVLDELGGDIVLVPEIKPGASPAQVDKMLEEIASRDLSDSVIVQSFDYATSQRVAKTGVASLYLTGDDAGDVTPKMMQDDGIEWFGPSKSMPEEEMESFTRAGIKVAPYTLATASEGEELDADVFGYFTDDPWK